MERPRPQVTPNKNHGVGGEMLIMLREVEPKSTPPLLDLGNARFAGRESNFLMNAIWKILTAVFGAGIASLLMELSLLREFIYVVGSSAFSNALIISVFLAGLATGTYFGAWKLLYERIFGTVEKNFEARWRSRKFGPRTFSAYDGVQFSVYLS